MRIFGIDLGTTNSLIAAMDGDRPRVFEDPRTGAKVLPSVVALGPDGPVAVGEDAIALEPQLRDGRESDGRNVAVIRSVKRYMGLGGSEVAPEDQARYAF